MAECNNVNLLSKNTLARSYKKRFFFFHSCKILQDFVEFCRNLAGILHKIPVRFLQNSCKIPQDFTGSCKILQECKKKRPLLVRSCKSIFIGLNLFISESAHFKKYKTSQCTGKIENELVNVCTN